MEDELARSLEFRDPRIGQVLQSRYRILKQLGRGGMGVVYLAEHVLIERRFAIKMLHSHLAASEETVQRFHREARAAAAIGNEHVVEVTDMGRLEDGSYFLVLEYLDGIDLAALIADEGPLPIARALHLGVQICDALAIVHQAGIVHRDLKPENIVVIDRPGVRDFVKILDFGICKMLNARPLTATGVALGTPRFMSPEQLQATPEIDGRADVYAVGAILYFALTGQTPFESESLPQLLVSIWNDPAPRVSAIRPDVPEALDALVARALEKHPDNRWQAAGELGAALASLAEPSEAESRHWALESGVREAASAIANTEGSPVNDAHTRVPFKYARGLVVAALGLSIAVFCGWLYLLAQSVESHAPPADRRPATPSNLRPDISTPSRASLASALDEANDVAPPAASSAPTPPAAKRVRPRLRRTGPAPPGPSDVPQPTAAATEPALALEPPPAAPSGAEVAAPEARPSSEPGTGSDSPSAPLVPAPAELKHVL